MKNKINNLTVTQLKNETVTGQWNKTALTKNILKHNKTEQKQYQNENRINIVERNKTKIVTKRS